MTTLFHKETGKDASFPKALLTSVRSITRIKHQGKDKAQFVFLSQGRKLIWEDLEIKLNLESDDDAADTKTLLSSE